MATVFPPFISGLYLTDSLYAAVGYYWNIALVGLSTFILIIHFSWQLRVSFAVEPVVPRVWIYLLQKDHFIVLRGTPDEEKALKDSESADDDWSSR
jgi:hypothetical protein